jgi:hypothetical protein
MRSTSTRDRNHRQLPRPHAIDIKGKPVGRRAKTYPIRRGVAESEIVHERIRSYSITDVEALRPKYEMGRRYFEVRRVLVLAAWATDDALSRFTTIAAVDAERDATRNTNASIALCCIRALSAAAEVVHELNMIATAEATRVASRVALSIVLDGQTIEAWAAASRAVELARWDDEDALCKRWRSATDGDSRDRWWYALDGWRSAARSTLKNRRANDETIELLIPSWTAAWCARSSHTDNLYPNRTIAEAASTTAEAARKASSRTRGALHEP